MTDPDVLILKDELDDLRESLSYWRREAAGLEDLAEEMRKVAADLRREVDILGDPFIPIRRLHNTSTWEGNAARQSRQRLDTNEGRFRGATRSIEGLAASLSADAGTTSSRAVRARREESAYFRQVVDIELELGLFDHI